MSDRLQAVEEFLRAAHMEEQLVAAAKAVAGFRPQAVLLAWEDEDGYKLLTIPHSQALAVGMLDRLNRVMQDDDDADDADDNFE